VLYKAISVRIKMQKDIECLFRKQESDVVYFDFLHVNPEVSVKSSPFYESDDFKGLSSGQRCKE
jgi:hypothetical protein